MRLRILFSVERAVFRYFFVRGRDSFKNLKGFEERELKLRNFWDKIFEIRFRLIYLWAQYWMNVREKCIMYIFEQFQVMIKWKTGKKRKIWNFFSSVNLLIFEKLYEIALTLEVNNKLLSMINFCKMVINFFKWNRICWT